MDHDDFVLYQQGGEIISGGYSINSLFLKQGMSPMKSFNNNLNDNLNGGAGAAKNNDVSSSLDSFAIPAGLFYINQKKNKKHEEKEEEEEKKKKNEFNKQHNMLPDDIYDKLFELIQYNKKPKQKQTKKYKQNSSVKKTKRNNKQ